MTTAHPVLPGAEAWSAPGEEGAAGVLVLHGFTGNPTSMRPLAEAFAAAGFAVELPRLTGHGTHVDDMLATTWADWSADVAGAYDDLAARVDRVVVAGLSMGGTLATWLAATRPEIAGAVLINPAIEPPADSLVEILAGALRDGVTVAPGIGSDVAKPGVTESAYPGTPIAPVLTLVEAQKGLVAQLSEIRCPILLMTSRNDHVVPSSSSDFLAERVSGPVERVWFDRSYHVATIDYDTEDIQARAVEFARKVTSG